MPPLLILLIGMIAVLGGIIVLRVNAFLALLGAAMIVSLLAPGEPAEKITRVAEAFGNTAGGVGIVIALAAIIGTAMMKSGAADRIVMAFLGLLGEKRAGTALAASSMVLSIPVFFDTVFYLMVPLARSLRRRTGKHYLKYVLAIGAGGVVAHTMVPPTPGPLAVGVTLGIDLGTMVLMGIVVSVPAVIVGVMFASWADRAMSVPFRDDPVAGGDEEEDTTWSRPLPGLLASLSPIILPVLLISSNTILSALGADEPTGNAALDGIATYAGILGNPNLALLLATVIAVSLYIQQRRPSRQQATEMVETSLMSGGLIILITAGGGAFGAMLQAAQIGPAVEGIVAGWTTSGFIYLFLGFTVASVIRIAQGSVTVAMITTAAILSPMLDGAGALPFHLAYVATAIGGGAMVGTWMNDSGFWIFTKMSGLTEVESMKSYAPMLAVTGIVVMLVTLILATLVPLV